MRVTQVVKPDIRHVELLDEIREFPLSDLGSPKVNLP